MDNNHRRIKLNYDCYVYLIFISKINLIICEYT